MRAADSSRFRILILGDFSGRAHRGEHAPQDLRERRFHSVDRDQFDLVFARLSVAVQIPTSDRSRPIVLTCKELEDLHPDRLLQAVPVFAELRALRRRLDNPATFAAAALELSGPPPAAAPDAAEMSTAGLLDVALANTAPARRTGSELVDALLREIVVPHVTPARDPRSKELVASVDAGIAAHMRRILRHPHLRALEAAWRGVEMLVRRLDTDRAVSLQLLDLTRAEIDSDLELVDAAPRSSLYRRIVDETVGQPGGQPFAAILFLDRIEPDLGSVRMLARLAALARAAGAPLLTDVSPDFVGTTSLHEHPDPSEWTGRLDASIERELAALRARIDARFVALALPRLLLRMPYGARGLEVAGFAFEELADALDHDGYLWGAGSCALALALGAWFERDGLDLHVDATVSIDGLPADVRERDGEMVLQPAAELVLTERAAEAIGMRGFCALRSIRGRDSITLGPIRALDGGLLAGPWS